MRTSRGGELRTVTELDDLSVFNVIYLAFYVLHASLLRRVLLILMLQ